MHPVDQMHPCFLFLRELHCFQTNRFHLLVLCHQLIRCFLTVQWHLCYQWILQHQLIQWHQEHQVNLNFQ